MPWLLFATAATHMATVSAAEQPREVAPDSRGAASFFVLPVGEPYIDVPERGSGAFDPELITLGGLWARYGDREWYIRLDPQACDLAGLQAGLTRDASRRDAFAAILGWPRNEVVGRLGALRGGYLQSHLDVINHGFSNGEAFGSPRRLAEGTAVLIDNRGIPVVRCACGNPLLSLPPQDEPPLPAQLADGGQLTEAPKLGDIDETPLNQSQTDEGGNDPVGTTPEVDPERSAPVVVDQEEQAPPEEADPAEVLEDILSEDEPDPIQVAQEEPLGPDDPLADLRAPPVPTGGMIGEFPEEELPLPLSVVVVALLPIADELGDDVVGDEADEVGGGLGGGGGEMPPEDEVTLPPPTSAPVPAAGWLFAGALAWLSVSRTRRRREDSLAA
ncbi:MAG: DUF6777 domain-containing protein [Pseudomonadota bacterium]